MIHINISDKTPPVEWLRRAQVVTDQLMATDNCDEKKRIIDRNQTVWADLKKWLLELSNNKCWYSEAREIVSHYHVDHFRPKNRSKQLDGSYGEWYWWLAFNWKNYRVSGSVCNQRKCDYFPLREGSHPCSSPTQDVDDEINYLLDPIDPVDPSLLTFDELGSPIPSVAEDTWDYKRVKETIRLLHLDYEILVDERKKVWQNCQKLINRAQNEMKTANTTISTTTKARLKSIFNDLREMISPKAELSATACACLLSSGIPWAMKLVRT